MAISLNRTEQSLPRIVDAITQLTQGRSNATGRVTLTPGTTTTTVSALNCSEDSDVFLSPRTASAAAALTTTYVSSTDQGGFTLTHANAGSGDRTFGYVALGG